ncbi:hypothetical protein [Mycobacterium attenuatum]|nr:hypothetical protein [Mycobacterium attenuatum]
MSSQVTSQAGRPHAARNRSRVAVPLSIVSALKPRAACVDWWSSMQRA